MARRRKNYSQLREKLRQEEAAEIAKLTPGLRLKLALSLAHENVRFL